MLRTLAALYALLLLTPAVTAQAQSVDLGSLPEHPRLFLRPALVDTLYEEWQSGPPKSDIFREIGRRAVNYVDDPLNGASYYILLMTIYGTMLNRDVQGSGDLYLDRAVEQLMYRYREIGGWGTDDWEYYIAYDWLFNEMEGSQQDSLRSYIYGQFPHPEIGQRTVYYNLEANEAFHKGIAGLACYGDGGTPEQDERFQILVDTCDGRMRGVREFSWPDGSANSLGGVLPAREFYFPDGGYYKGVHYGQKDLSSIVDYLFLFDDLGLGSYWDLCESFLENSPLYYLWMTRPDGSANRIMMGNIFGLGTRALRALSLLAWRKDCPWAQWIMNGRDWPYSGSSGHDWYWAFVCYRSRPTSVSLDDLPLHIFYGSNGPGPNNGTSWHERVVTRTGWDISGGSDDVYLNFTSGDYFGDYHNCFEPTFEIYYRGALAIRSGYYGSGPQNVHYYSCNVSCNSVAVFDSTQTYNNDRWGTDWLYDDDVRGGPGRPRHIYDVRDERSKFDVAEIDVFEVLSEEIEGNPAYYLRAYLNPEAAFYYSNSSRRVEKLQRELFWTGQHFISADIVKIDAAAAAPKQLRWLMHMIEEPSVSSDLLYSVVPGHVDVFERGAYSSQRVGGTYDGKLTVQALLPDDAIMRRVGGSGYECWVDQTWTTGVNYPASNESWYSGSYEVGRWRVESIAPAATDSVSFLHYIYVGTDGDVVPQAVALEGSGMIGCTIEGLGVISFHRGAEGAPMMYETTGQMLEVPHWIGGLIPGLRYAVTESSGQEEILSADSGGVLKYRISSPGTTQIIVHEPEMAVR